MPSLPAFFERLHALPLSTHIRESLYLFPALDVLHVLALLLMVGSVAVVDLRLLGLVFREIPISRLSAQVLPFTWAAAVLTFGSGLLLFLPQASSLYANPPLQVKMALLAFAGGNIAVWHRSLSRRQRDWDRRASPPWQARLAGAASLALWAGVIVCGRLIAFVF